MKRRLYELARSKRLFVILVWGYRPKRRLTNCEAISKYE